jgi:peroxiredoxin
MLRLGVCALALSLLFISRPSLARHQDAASESSIQKRIRGLRALPDDQRGPETKQLALQIRQLKQPAQRLDLADGLANLATEGDFGHDTLQEVATTLAEALRTPPKEANEQALDMYYYTLAQLVRYEHVKAPADSPHLRSALAQIDADDTRRQRADFTLKDLNGNPWTLKELHGKVVLVNFWATWCPPCRKEIPDLQALYDQFKAKGLVVLGISDEKADVVQPFVAKNNMTYPVLLDTDRKVNTEFVIQGIPRTVIYDRNGKLAAEAIDMRTRRQLLALLARAGMK